MYRVWIIALGTADNARLLGIAGKTRMMTQMSKAGLVAEEIELEVGSQRVVGIGASSVRVHSILAKVACKSTVHMSVAQINMPHSRNLWLR